MMQTYADFSKLDFDAMRKSYNKVQFDDEDEIEKKNVERVFRIANKSCIHWARLFVYSFDQLVNIDDDALESMLKDYHPLYSRVAPDLEEYDREIRFGRNNFYNSISKAIYDNIFSIKQLVNFTFTKILYQSSTSSEEEF